MKTVCKIGTVDEIVAAVAEELKGCCFFIYCADDMRFKDITKGLKAALDGVKSIGTTGFMLTDKGGMGSGITAIGFYDDEIEVGVGTLRKAGACPIKYVPGLIWHADDIYKRYKDNSICIEFAAGHEEMVVSTMKVGLEQVGMRLVGATSGNTSEGQNKKVAANGKVLEDSAAYAVIGSKMGRIDVYKENIFRPRKKTHIVTKVSEDLRTIIEIDNRRAIDVYREEVGADCINEKGIYEHPLCRIVGNEYYIAGVFSFNQDGTITTYKNIQINDMLCFTDIEDDFKGFIRDNMQNIHSNANGNIEGIVSINCILRYLFFGEQNYVNEYVNLLSETSNGKYWGMISDGEQYIEQHVNQSMVCAVFTREK